MIENKAMRDVFIERIHQHMFEDNDIFFVSADFGSPKLDALRNDFPDRFVNVGIAEQNLINVSTGLALEGFKVFAYAIAPFLTMRAFEQIRVNISLNAQLKDININLVGVGAGLSYDVSGPTHHCLEDLSIMRTLPNIEVFSPSDWSSTLKYADRCITVKEPKYLRLEGKPHPSLYDESSSIDFERGFSVLREGTEVCLVSTGIMTHRALEAARILEEEGIKAGVIDLYLLRPMDESAFYDTVCDYGCLVTLEEAFINKGGLDSLVSTILESNDSTQRLRRIGFGDAYSFEIGNRDELHELFGIDSKSIADFTKAEMKRA